MATHIDVGKRGEKLAELFLANRGHTILHRNWRYGRFELDLVTLKNDMLHIIEVKYRSSNTVALPEDAVNKKKLRSLMQAIDQFLFLNCNYNDFRLDILSITEHAGNNIEYFLLEDVYL